MIDRSSRVFIAGHRGMVGSAVVRRLESAGCTNLVLRDRSELDLLDQSSVEAFLASEPLDWVVVAAARVGGIHANDQYPFDFIYENLMIECNLIRGSLIAGVPQLLFLGSSCIYPKHSPQPMAENRLLTGALEPTNEPYAIAKIAGIKLCESSNRQHGTDYRSVMPTNLFGPGDNYHPLNSHVIPALIRRFHEAKTEGVAEVEVWGSGRARREFLYVEDLADACHFVMGLDRSRYAEVTHPQMSHVNVGTGTDVTIAELASLIAETVGFEGRIVFNDQLPDGAPRKLLDCSLLHGLGWSHSTSLMEGLQATYEDFLSDGELRK